MTADTSLQRDLLARLDYEPAVDAAGIGVTVHEGVVTLTGYVRSEAELRLAERTASSLAGVRAVVNELTVQPSGQGSLRADARIAEDVVRALKWHVQVPPDRIVASVKEGWVTLEGIVDWSFEKKAAEDAVRGLPGPSGMTSNISVRPRVAAGDVRRQIEDALRRTAEVDAGRVSVTVLGSKITLSGAVRSLAERRDAEVAAWTVPGVTDVQNLLWLVKADRRWDTDSGLRQGGSDAADGEPGAGAEPGGNPTRGNAFALP